MPTNLLSPTLARWLADHHGVVTTQELRAAGVGPNGHRSAVRQRRAAPGHPRRLRRDNGRADVRAPLPPAVLPPSRRLRHGTDGRHAGGPAPPTTVGGSALLDPARGAPRRRSSASCFARPRRCELRPNACAPTASSSPRVPASRSTWPPTCASSTIARSSSSCSTGGSSPPTSWRRSVGASAIRPAAAARRSGGHCSASAANRRTRIPRSSSTTRSGRWECPSMRRCPSVRGGWRDDPRRPRRAGGAVGHRAGHPSRAPQRRRPPTGQPPGALAARRGLADRAGLRARHGRRRGGSPPSSPSCTATARSIRVFGGTPRCAVRHSVAFQTLG